MWERWEGGGDTSSSSGVIVTKDRSVGMENPFSLKVGQVFTGFGIGCGIGIGVGRPINLGAIPMLNQVMMAARGATDAFSGVGRHLNPFLRKLGAKNVEAGIGCGVGIGHGFGVGLALKPGAIHQLQSSLMLAMATMMKKFGIAPTMPAIQGFFPASLKDGPRTVDEGSNRNSLATVVQSVKRVPGDTYQNDPADKSQISSHEIAMFKSSPSSATYSRTDEVISNFLQNPLLQREDSEINEKAKRFSSENDIQQMVLRHQKLIEELMEENEKLRKILVKDVRGSPEMFQGSYMSSSGSKLPCDECFECRRRHRRR